METGTSGQERESTVTQTYEERRYPQLDCVGTYVWIWERLARPGGQDAPRVVARRVDRADRIAGSAAGAQGRAPA